MTVERYFAAHHEEPFHDGTVIPFPQPHNEIESTLTESERAFLADFRAFAAAPDEYEWKHESAEERAKRLETEERLGPIDIASEDPKHAPQIALAAHRFIARTGTAAVLERKEEQATGKELEPLYAIPEPSIERRIKQYYKDFGTNRRSKSPVLLAQEEEYLRRQGPIYAMVYDADRSNPVPRYKVFPELGYGIALKQLMEKLGNQVAADGVEAVLASYGDRFLERARTAGRAVMINRSVMGQLRDTHNIIHWADDEIPEEHRAEKYRPR